jgi:hypothetical protein
LLQPAAFCQVPAAPQVCGCVVLAHWVWPGAHTPWQAPPTQVWFEHAEPVLCQAPLALHVCGCWPVHC